MATLQNLNNAHIAPETSTQVNESISSLETALKPFLVNLTPDERRRYGSISEQNKLLVNKAYDYAKMQPDLTSPDVEWEEFFKDFADRNFLETTIARLQKIIDGLNNAKTLHDFDNYQGALADYAFTQYKAMTASPGFETKQRDLQQFFLRPTAVGKTEGGNK